MPPAPGDPFQEADECGGGRATISQSVGGVNSGVEHTVNCFSRDILHAGHGQRFGEKRSARPILEAMRVLCN